MTLYFGDGSNISTYSSVPSSLLSGALPSISGANLTGVAGVVVDAASSHLTSEGNSRYGTNVLTVSVSPSSSSNRVIIIANCEIKNQHAGYITTASISTSNGSDLGDYRYSSRLTWGSNTYKRHTFVEYDYASNTSTRTYHLHMSSNNTHTSTKAYWKNCAITAICFAP